MKAKDRNSLIATLKSRFEQNMDRHPKLRWAEVATRIEDLPRVLTAIMAMENSGGEPDVILFKNKSMAFCDCAVESPSGRRSLCYDDVALRSRKANKPVGSALEMANQMGIQLLDEEQYRYLQTIGEFDLKTSSWIATPDDVRSLGGALFCDRRFGKVFVYHNGAESYYAARGFRAFLEI